MNSLEKRSFFSFLLLYLSSSLLFLSLSAYWYFHTQKLSLENIHYYKMQHRVDQINAKIIISHMMHKKFILGNTKPYKVALYDENKNLLHGSNLPKDIDFKKDLYYHDDAAILVSRGSHGHLGVHYVVLIDYSLEKLIRELRDRTLLSFFTLFVIIGAIGWILSKMFLKPIRSKIEEIERFIKDITHEFNTPITALMLSSKRLKEKAVFDEKAVKNISISTKQLFEMYKSLAYTSFAQTQSTEETLAFKEIVLSSIDYFDELLDRKKITLESKFNDVTLCMQAQKATMLVNNILSNAVKYSMPETTITVELTPEYLCIKDEGIGIEKKDLELIFQRFTRASDYAGGFGVGLSVVKQICVEYQFRVEIESELNRGTSIKILF